MEDQIQIIIQLVGYHCVGKSTTLLNYTINIDEIKNFSQSFAKKTININEHIISLAIWDFYFNELYLIPQQVFHSRPHGLPVIFDITNRKTFEHAKKFIDSLNQFNYQKPFYLVLVGNKIDLENEREVSKEEAQNFANMHKLKYFETSAKNSEGLDDVFNNLAVNIYDKIITKGADTSVKGQVFEVDGEQQSKKGYCW